MKWKAKRIGDTRVVRIYCLLPRKIGNYWHWLEYVNIKQEYTWCLLLNAWEDIEVV